MRRQVQGAGLGVWLVREEEEEVREAEVAWPLCSQPLRISPLQTQARGVRLRSRGRGKVKLDGLVSERR